MCSSAYLTHFKYTPRLNTGTPAFLHLPQSKLASFSHLMGKSENPVHVTDIAPTLVALASNGKMTDSYDGKNILTVPQRNRPIVLQHDPYSNQSAFLEYPFKLILGSPGTPTINGEPTSDYFQTIDGSESSIIGREYHWLEENSIPEALSDRVDDLGIFIQGRFTIVTYSTYIFLHSDVSPLFLLSNL